MNRRKTLYAYHYHFPFDFLEKKYYGVTMITSQALTYSSLYLTALLLWFPFCRKIKPWWFSCVCTIALAVSSGIITIIGLIFLSLFALSCYSFSKATPLLKILLGVIISLMGIALMSHNIPGFHNLKMINQVTLGPDSLPYSLYLNMDKALMGIILLGFLHPLSLKKYTRIWLPTGVTILLVFLVAYGFSWIRLDLKFPVFSPIWLINNLLATCLAEEALFRGFIQRQLTVAFGKNRYFIAWLIASVLFGALHFPGGIHYVLLATLAGFGYGFIYHKTQRIEASIFAHFLLNTIHFLCFSYPGLNHLS